MLFVSAELFVFIFFSLMKLKELIYLLSLLCLLMTVYVALLESRQAPYSPHRLFFCVCKLSELAISDGLNLKHTLRV